MISLFTGGCPRSGTTMLGSLLGSHPCGATLPESQFKIEAIRGATADTDAGRRAERLMSLLQSHRFTGWHAAAAAITFGDLHRGSYREQPDVLVNAYLRSNRKEGTDFVVDNTPSNKNYFPTLRDLYPEARFIHIVRDGRAVANSVLQNDWGPNTGLLAAYWWQHHLANGLAAEHAFGPERILRIRYEDVLDDPKRELTRICAWIEIDYSQQMLEPNTATLDVRSATFNALATRGPVQERAHAWRNELASRQVEIFEFATRDLLRYLGYELEFGNSARGASVSEVVLAGLKELFKGTMDFALYHARRQRLKQRVACENK